MADHRYHRHYRGNLLPRVAYSLGVPKDHHKEVCKILHTAFKEYLCVTSTADLSNSQFMVYMSAVLMLMAREKGKLIPFYNEPENVDQMSMPEWLRLQKIIDT